MTKAYHKVIVERGRGKKKRNISTYCNRIYSEFTAGLKKKTKYKICKEG